LLDIGRFAVSPEQPDIPQFRRTPGYPLFIAGIYRLFGQHHLLVILVQIGVSLLTVAYTYALAALLWNARLGLLAAIWLCCDLASHINTLQLLTDTLFTSVLTVALLCGLLTFRSESPRSSILFASLFGLLCACASLIRPIAYYLFFPTAILCLWHWIYQCRWRYREILCGVGCLIIAWGSLTLGWQFRNYRLCGSAELSHVTGANLLFYGGASLVAKRDGLTFVQAQRVLGFYDYTRRFPETNGWSICRLDERWKREGVRIIARHPKQFAWRCVREGIKMILGLGEQTTLQFWGIGDASSPLRDVFVLSWRDYLATWVLKHPLLLAIFFTTGMALLACYISIGVSLCVLLRSPMTGFYQQAHLFLWTIILCIFMLTVLSGVDVYSRFRIPMMPIFCAYAAHGLSMICSRRGIRHAIRHGNDI